MFIIYDETEILETRPYPTSPGQFYTANDDTILFTTVGFFSSFGGVTTLQSFDPRTGEANEDAIRASGAGHRNVSVASLEGGEIIVNYQPNYLSGPDLTLVSVLPQGVSLEDESFLRIEEHAIVEAVPVIALSNGNALVSWNEQGTRLFLFPEFSVDSYAQIIAPDGTEIGSPILLHELTVGRQGAIETVATETGGFLSLAVDAGGLDGDGQGIFVRGFDADGTALGADAQVNVTTALDQREPAITRLADGTFVVVWASTDTADEAAPVIHYGRFLDAAGQPSGDEFLLAGLSPETEDTIGSIDVVPLDEGGFVVMSDIFIDDRPSYTALRTFDADGVAQGDPLALSRVVGLGFQAEDGSFVLASDNFYNGRLGGTIERVFITDDSDVLFEGTDAADDQRGTSGPDTIFGGDGDDRLFGRSGDDDLFGQAGDDGLYGGSGDDRLVGQSGNDLLVGGSGADHLFGGTGFDRAQYGGSDGLWVDLAGVVENTGDARGDTFVGVEGLRGSAGNDRLRGDGDDNLLEGRAGDDLLNGRGGDDRIVGGLGDDTLRGAAGDDTLNGGDGDDILEGSRGADDLNGNFGNDILRGGDGDDMLSGGGGDDLLDGGTGSDEIQGGTGDADIAVYTAASDQYAVTKNSNGTFTVFRENPDGDDETDILGSVEFLQFTDGTFAINELLPPPLPVIRGTSASETIDGTADAEVIKGRAGNDTINAGDGDDTVNGGAGNDDLRGDAGADLIDGGGGIDWAGYYASDAAVTVNLATNVNTGGYAEGDTLRNIEWVGGTVFDDSLTGNSSDNRLAGWEGDDFLDGGDGDADLAQYRGTSNQYVFTENRDGTYTVSGGIDGTDTLTGIEVLEFTDGTFTLAELLAPPSGIIEGTPEHDRIDGTNDAEIINGRAGDDTINAGGGNDTVNGGAGNDDLRGEAGADRIDGGAGIDWAGYYASNRAVIINLQTGVNTDGHAEGDILDNIEWVGGTPFSDFLFGDGGDNRLVGWEGNDTLYGRAGNDELFGEFGNDFLDGGRGDDVLTTGFGNNTLFGGDGNDTLIVAGGINTLNGGSGSDTFVFSVDQATITDFSRSENDRIRIDRGDINNWADVQAVIATSNQSDTLAFNGSSNLTLRGVDINSLEESDFIFL